MVDRLLESNQVRLFIRNFQPTYGQHLQFMPFENFTALRNIGMILKEELAREVSAKIGSNWKGNFQNSDKKDNDFTSKEVHVLDWYIHSY